MPGESPIFCRLFDLLLWVSDHTEKYPKSERFRLARRIEDSAFQIHSLLLRAAYQNHTDQDDRNPVSQTTLSYLREADLALKQLQFYFRIAHEKHLTTTKQYAHVSEKLIEIGKLLGGWIKKV